VTVSAVVTVVGAVAVATDVVPQYAFVGPVLASGFVFYTIGAEVPGARGTVAVLAGVAVLEAGTVAAPDAILEFSELAFAAFVPSATWIVGRWLRERRLNLRRAAEAATTRAVTDERLRIAREMHDVVGHSLSLITVQAAIANHVAGQRPEEAGAALKVIESASRSALAELRRTVHALRSEREPVPILDELHRLVEKAGDAGVVVRLEVRVGDGIPDAVTLAAYRIVQESLTNVVKHAGPTTCRVNVEGGRGELRVEVTDDGARVLPGSPVAGAGLTGMRERVAEHQGTFAAGPRIEGGFTVVATLPYGG
jgi:signal transduction histidine kinase